MQSPSTFIKIPGFISEVKKKKSELINDWENIFAYYKEFEQGEALVNKLVLFQLQLGDLGGSTTQGKFCNFFFHLN